jgi:hypothetical protein
VWGDDRICQQCPRGHITLRCPCNPDLHWSTKNLGYSIGARTIFFMGGGDECFCPPGLLYHDHARDGGAAQ